MFDTANLKLEAAEISLSVKENTIEQLRIQIREQVAEFVDFKQKVSKT